jgi:uncharacterized membrane protein YgdD (TMEM256/DUF423 family)
MHEERTSSLGKTFIVTGSISAFLAVLLGAFGAHGLKAKLSTEMFTVYETGFDYHILHSIGLIVVGIISRLIAHSRLILWAGLLLSSGILLFSGSLYVLSVTGIRWLGAITPFGGLCFLAGWLVLGVAALKEQ